MKTYLLTRVAYIGNKRCNRKKPMVEFEEMFEDTNGVIINHTSKDRQQNDQKRKHKGSNNDLQNITQKTKDRTT